MKLLLLILMLFFMGCAPECEDPIYGAINTGADISSGLIDIDLDTVLVSSGQSNSSGVQPYKFQYEELPNTYFFLDGYWYADYPYDNTGPEASLINNIAISNTDKNIGVIKYAKGGTSLRHSWSLEGDLYQTLIETVKDGLYKANAEKVEGFFWMQGESDASIKAYSLKYRDTFIDFIGALREDLGYTYIFSGLIGYPMKNSVTYIQNVRNAQINVSATLQDVYLVDTTGLEKCCDNLHFNIESQKILGELFASTYMEVN